jgi:hypothetical protein
VSGVVSRVVLGTTTPVTGKAFDLRASLTSQPASVHIEILRPDWGLDSLNARMEGLTAWISYTPPMDGTYSVYVTAFGANNQVVGAATIAFTVGGSGSRGGGGGGCDAALAGLAILACALPLALKRKAK